MRFKLTANTRLLSAERRSKADLRVEHAVYEGCGRNRVLVDGSQLTAQWTRDVAFERIASIKGSASRDSASGSPPAGRTANGGLAWSAWRAIAEPKTDLRRFER